LRWFGLAWYIQRFLEKLGMSDSQAIIKTRKIYNFEDWLLRHPITIAMITFDPKDCLNEWKEMSVSMDAFRLVRTRGRWRKVFTWSAKASPKEKED